LLGWNPGTEQEIFSMDELINSFSIDRVGKSGSRFDPEKAKWFNHQYLQKKSNTQLALEFREFLRAKGYHIDIIRLEVLIELVKERVNFVKDIWEQTDFFFRTPEEYDQVVAKKIWKEDSPALLKNLRSLLATLTDFSASSTELAIKTWIEHNGYNTGNVMNVFRLVIVGASRGPHMYDIISWIGKDETLKRIDKGITRLSK
jgi:glutamyl/glutaminyl-tRNA synthetase